MTFRNDKKAAFLAKIPIKGCDHDDSLHAKYSKFCFAYFAKQPAGQDFSDWDHQKLTKLLNHLHEYCKFPLKHWEQQPIGHGKGRVLAIYNAFPAKSEFTLPPQVPNDARWGRFRLDQRTRLIGFIVPEALDGNLHKTTNHRFDINTFYVVFLDADHKFYVTEDA